MAQTRHGIEDELRRRIREGIYKPGQRMPSHRELLDDLKTSSATLQAAFDRLVEQGYVGARTARGTYVSRVLPHRSTIALVIPDGPASQNWNRLYATAKRVAEDWSEGETRFRVYCILRENLASDGHRQLCADLADGGLAGLVFMNSAFYLKATPAMATALPRVCINASNDGEPAEFGYSCVNVADGGTFERILKRFRAGGAKRIAAIANLGGLSGFLARSLPLVEQAGLETRPAWWLGLPIQTHHAKCARAVVRLLLDGDARSRPDSLIIADDNLVPHATAGILDAALDPGHGVLVAAHANLPGPTHAAVPCLRYGPDLVAQLRSALAELAVLAAGGRPRVLTVPFGLHEAETPAR